MITKDDKLRLLCHFQHWLGTHYNNLPTDSGNMTERSRKFLKENEQAFSLFDVSVNEVVRIIKNKNMDKYTRKAVFSELKKYDHIAGESDFIEVTEWKNGEGFDVEIVGKLTTRFQLTWGEYTALKKLVKKLDS